MAQEREPTTQLMVSSPGMSRDGTQLARDTYNDALWCRWYQKLPRKMLGYREQLRALEGVVRAIDIFSENGYSYVHTGSATAVQRYALNNATGQTTGLIDRTPPGYLSNAQMSWQFTEMFNVQDSTTSIFASATPNMPNLGSTEELPVYYGDIVGVGPLVAIPDGTVDPVTASGGCCAIGPFLFLYGAYGVVKWSAPGAPLDFEGVGSGDARPVPAKIVRAMPLRGQSGPAIILWSLDSVVIGTFVGGADVFDFTTVTTNGSILSSNSVIEHNGVYYWATTSGFSMFNGVVRDLPNDFNRQWFFKNLNLAQRQKVFAMKIPRWNELWWCFPFGAADECTYACIYNWNQNVWYDTVLPNGGRSAGMYEFVFNFPLMAGVVANEDTSGGYSLWQHEFGLNEVSGPQPTAKAIKSYYETSEFNFVAPPQPGQLGTGRATSYSLMEPDFDQVGDLMFSVISRANARAPETVVGPVVLPAVPTHPGEQIAGIKATGRLTRFRIESNTLDGDYVTGSPVVHSQPGDSRRTG